MEVSTEYHNKLVNRILELSDKIEELKEENKNLREQLQELLYKEEN